MEQKERDIQFRERWIATNACSFLTMGHGNWTTLRPCCT